MNKSESVATMAEKANLSKKDTEDALNAFVDAVKDAVKKNDKVQLQRYLNSQDHYYQSYLVLILKCSDIYFLNLPTFQP